MTKREDVYKAIDSEREYQDKKWNPSTTSTGGKHSVMEFLVYMEHQIAKAKAHLSEHGEPGASTHALEIVRKATALGVSCMEQHGAPHRAPQKP